MIRDFIGLIAAILLLFTLLFGGILGLVYENEKWNCDSYPSQTRMIAGTCMIKDSGRWVTYSSYVDEKNVHLKN